MRTMNIFYQQLMAFVDDNLMTVGGTISHHDKFPAVDEDLSPSLENMVLLHWLKLIHQDLLRPVKQRYGSEPCSLKQHISQAISSLLDEIHSISETKIMQQATYNQPRRPTHSPAADLVAWRGLTDVVKGTCYFSNRSSLQQTYCAEARRWKPIKRLTKQKHQQPVYCKEMAIPLPERMLVSKKTGKGASLLQQSLRELHREFCSTGTRTSG